MSFIYISSFRRRFVSNEERFFLNLQDLHARFNFNSTPLRMLRVQRPLSVDELHSTFKQSKQTYPTSSDPASDSSPASSRSFRSLSPRSFSSKKNLSMRLSNIQIFDGSKPDVFLDWKLKMLDKLRYNADHFIGTNKKERKGFKIAYIISRLGEEASIQTL